LILAEIYYGTIDFHNLSGSVEIYKGNKGMLNKGAYKLGEAK